MRRFKVYISPGALDEIELSVEYYNGLKKGLGKRFSIQVKETLKSIRNNPFYTSIRYSNIRCAIMEVFPFLVHYEIDDKHNVVNVLTVHSTHQRPLWDEDE